MKVSPHCKFAPFHGYEPPPKVKQVPSLLQLLRPIVSTRFLTVEHNAILSKRGPNIQVPVEILCKICQGNASQVWRL